MSVDLTALPDDPATSQQMLRDLVAATDQRQTVLQAAMQDYQTENDSCGC